MKHLLSQSFLIIIVILGTMVTSYIIYVKSQAKKLRKIEKNIETVENSIARLEEAVKAKTEELKLATEQKEVSTITELSQEIYGIQTEIDALFENLLELEKQYETRMGNLERLLRGRPIISTRQELLPL